MSTQLTFAQPVKVLRDHFSKIILTSFYTPVLVRYAEFEEKYQNGISQLDREKGLDDNTLPIFMDAIDTFSFEELKNHSNNFPINIGQMLFNWEDDFFKSRYVDINPIFNKYTPSEIQIQSLRNSLISFTRIFYSDMAEMEKSWRFIQSAITQANDTSANTRSGLTGGSIGALLGSLVLPGIGTVIGGAAGGWWMGKNRTENIISQISTHIDNYTNHTRNLIKLFHSSARELYLLSGKIYEEVQLNKIRKTYYEIKKSRKDADIIAEEYFKFHLTDIESFYKTQMYENSDYSWGEAIDYVENFLKNFQPIE